MAAHAHARHWLRVPGAISGWVTLRARWVTLRARWVTLRARWVTLRARWGDAKSSLGDAKSSLGDAKSSLWDYACAHQQPARPFGLVELKGPEREQGTLLRFT
jgi:hypothetical protein